MPIRICILLLVTACLCAACVPTSAPPPTPISLATPTITFERLPTLSPPPAPGAAATPIALPVRYTAPFPPADVPACSGVQELEHLPFRFGWDMTGTRYEDVFANAPVENWTYYRCGQPPASLAAFYRQLMTLPLWEEHTSDERTQGTLLIFDNGPVTVSPAFRWVYLWILPAPSDSQSSYLVAAWWNGPKTC